MASCSNDQRYMSQHIGYKANIDKHIILLYSCTENKIFYIRKSETMSIKCSEEKFLFIYRKFKTKISRIKRLY